jgi:hypothetical protein
MRIEDRIEVKQNVKITCRERGKIVARREGHNIWLNYGRAYLAQLIGYQSIGPDVPFINHRIKYMGFGIGGTRQLALPTANSAPMTEYPGTNAQTDTDATVLTLERPVRISGGSGPPAFGDQWVGTVNAPATLAPTQVTFIVALSGAEISYSPYLSVPLSEIGLFTAEANPQLSNNRIVAYDTFDTLSKTLSIAVEVEWTIKF